MDSDPDSQHGFLLSSIFCWPNPVSLSLFMISVFVQAEGDGAAVPQPGEAVRDGRAGLL